MCEKDRKIKELEARLEHETNINKLTAERELMFWQGKNEKRKFNWFYPMMAGAGALALLQAIVSAVTAISN